MKFTQLTPSEFQLFSDSYANANLYQTIDTALFRKSQGATAEFVGIKQGDSIIAAAMITSRRTHLGREYSSPGGFLIDYTNKTVLTFFLQHLQAYLKQRGAFALSFAPRIGYRERDIDGNIVQDGFDNSEIITNLTQLGCIHYAPRVDISTDSAIAWNFQRYLTGHTEATLLASFRQTTRQSIRKSIASGVTVREAKRDELLLFANLINASSDRNGIPMKSVTYYEAIRQCFTKSARIRFLIAEKEGTALSAAMFIYHKQTVHYVFAGTPTEFLPSCPQFAIVWESMRSALINRCTLYDFGGIGGDFTQGSADRGLLTFKRGFRGHVVEYIGDFALVVSPSRYRLYRQWKALRSLTHKKYLRNLYTSIQKT